MRLCPVCGYRMDERLFTLGYTRHPLCARWTPLERAARSKAQVEVEVPVRPYADGTAGWSGTETSLDGEPVRAASQRAVLAFVEDAGWDGATVAEVREGTGLHHGVASGALSVLHKTGRIARLTTKRGRCRIYVRLDLVTGRETD